MKILALDVGDVHTGTALSDSQQMFASPYKTIPTLQLEEFIEEILAKENISTVVIGYPKTLRGTISEQTQKVINVKEALEKMFGNMNFVLWDERFTSKQAQSLKQAKTKEEKVKSHSIAAAFILESYLDHLRFKKSMEELES